MIIRAAAIGKSGKVYEMPAPARHHHILKLLHDEGDKLDTGNPDYELGQGFIDDKEGFVSRARALEIVREQGQEIISPGGKVIGAVLTSEDLW